jgi:tricorn protease
MELNGAVPDVILWPAPGDMPRGKDVQLEKAVEVLLADVKAWQERPQPTLRKASER